MLVGTARAERAKAERASRFVRTRVDMGRGTRVFPIAYSVIGQGCRGRQCRRSRPSQSRITSSFAHQPSSLYRGRTWRTTLDSSSRSWRRAFDEPMGGQRVREVETVFGHRGHGGAGLMWVAHGHQGAEGGDVSVGFRH